MQGLNYSEVVRLFPDLVNYFNSIISLLRQTLPIPANIPYEPQKEGRFNGENQRNNLINI